MNIHIYILKKNYKVQFITVLFFEYVLTSHSNFPVATLHSNNTRKDDENLWTGMEFLQLFGK